MTHTNRMSPEQRAEKILFIAQEKYGSNCLKDIASEIRAAEDARGDLVANSWKRELDYAVEEAIADFSKDANIVLETSVDAARSEALEKAAKIAGNYDPKDIDTDWIRVRSGIVEAIRALKESK